MSDNRFKIGYFADGPWAHEAFELLNADPEIEIQFIVPRTDTEDDILKKYADANNIDYLYPVKINSQEFYNKAKLYNSDLFVSMSFNQIFRNKIIELPRLNTINCHAGKLPFYRGRNILNWALINGEEDFGITVHFVDEGIDTGDIILQRLYPISIQDNYKTLLERAYKECAAILYDAIKKIQKNNYERIDQSKIHPVGFYCGRRGEGDEIINWNQKSIDVFNFIRALCDPGPIATTFLSGEKVKINKCSLIPDAPSYINTPGQILSKTSQGYLVKTLDSFVEIQDIHSNIKLKVGDKLVNG